MKNTTTFDPQSRYIILPIFVSAADHSRYKFKAILDTGVPSTEFSDEALQYLGFLDNVKHNIELKNGLQTQKYGKIILPHVEICSHAVDNLDVYVSHFERSWGIKALIGLDFFRHFRITIGYRLGQIITESYE